MPATGDDVLSPSSEDKREKFQPSPYAQSYGDHEGDEEWTHLLPRDHKDDEGERRDKRDTTSSTRIDRVVLEKREKFQPSPYAQSYGDHEGDEEWTHLLPRDHKDDDPTTSMGPKRSLFSSIRRHIGFLMCFLALLTFIMAMLICVVWAVPGIFTDTIIIAPNDTVMAAYEVDTRDTHNIQYTLSLMTSGEVTSNAETLVIYNGTCDGLKASSVEVHINDSVSAKIERLAVGRLYLAAHSTLDYIVKLSLSSDIAPSGCFATLHIFKSYDSFNSFLDSNDTSQAVSSHDFCNNSTINFTLVVQDDEDDPSYYYFFGLYAANRGQVKSVNVQASGTIFYYDVSSFLLNKVCHIVPSINSSCDVPTGHVTDYANVCLLITRGTPYIPGTDPDTIATVAMGNGIAADTGNNDDIIQLKRKVTTYWGLNRAAVFVCLFVPLLISCCVLTILTPRRANYGSYIWVNRKKPLN